MDWITVDEEIFEHAGKRISEGDTALYGRVTYQLMESYWPTAAAKPDGSTHETGIMHLIRLQKIPDAPGFFSNGLQQIVAEAC